MVCLWQPAIYCARPTASVLVFPWWRLCLLSLYVLLPPPSLTGFERTGQDRTEEDRDQGPSSQGWPICTCGIPLPAMPVCPLCLAFPPPFLYVWCLLCLFCVAPLYTFLWCCVYILRLEPHLPPYLHTVDHSPLPACCCCHLLMPPLPQEKCAD